MLNRSVCEKELQRHVAKCPQKLIEERIVSQPCYSHNVNLFAPGFDSSTSALQLDVSDLPRTSDKHNLDNTWLKMMLAKHLLSRGQFEQLVARINHSFQEVFGAESIGETKVIQEHVLLPLFCEHLFKLGASYVFLTSVCLSTFLIHFFHCLVFRSLFSFSCFILLLLLFHSLLFFFTLTLFYLAFQSNMKT